MFENYRKLTLFLSFFVFCTTLISQEELHVKHSCNFAEGNKTDDLYTYDASKEAVEIIDKIMKVNVLPQNFTIKSADCSNALATVQDKTRYILYNTSFLENFKRDAQTAWAAYCVLAHEIGHHLSNHDLEESNPSVRKRYELEADKFAGGVLFKMGALLEEAQAGINTFSNETATTTHPPKKARLEAIAVGWKQAQELAEYAATPDTKGTITQKEQAVFKKALTEKDPEKAMQLLDEVIELNGNFLDAYFERGKLMRKMPEIRRNYNYAVEDLNKYMEVNKKNPVAFFERGIAFFILDKHKEATDDFDRAIRLKPSYEEAFLHRALVKRYANQFEGAESDYKQAVKINPKFTEGYYEFGNYYYGFGEYAKAIEQFNAALSIDSSHYQALALRAASKHFSGRYAEAILDFNLLEKKFPKDFDEYYNRAQCYQYVGKHIEAIADFDRVVKNYPDTYDVHYQRGVSKYILGKLEDADQDFTLFFKKNNPKLMNNSNFKVEKEEYALPQQAIGCLFVNLKMFKVGYEWLDLALASRPNLERAKECRGKK